MIRSLRKAAVERGSGRTHDDLQQLGSAVGTGVGFFLVSHPGQKAVIRSLCDGLFKAVGSDMYRTAGGGTIRIMVVDPHDPARLKGLEGVFMADHYATFNVDVWVAIESRRA